MCAEAVLVGFVADLSHLHVGSEGPSLCIPVERCFLFHCPFRITFASKIGLRNKSLTVLDPPLNSSLPTSLLPMTAEVQVCTDLHTFDKHILTHWLVH